MPGPAYPLEWIDEYVSRLRDFVFVRSEDSLLIKVPNEAHRLNASGIRVLERLLGGESVMDLWASFGGTETVRRDLYEFFTGLKQVLQGCVNEQRPPRAVSRTPFELGFSSLPILSEVALTYRCNLRCQFCYAACGCRREEGAGEMTTEEARRILEIIRHEAQVPSVSFTGGEPTLRRDLPALVRHARSELGMRTNLITNGTLIDEALADDLGAAGLHSAQVSIEAPEEGVHDSLTGSTGAFLRSVAAVGRLRERGIRVHTNTTINQRNIRFLDRMPEFVRGLGLERLSMNLVIPVGSAGAGHIGVRYAEVATVLPGIHERARLAGVEFMWYSPTPVCLFNPIAHGLGNKGCAACDGLLSVSPSGDVLPCSSWPEPVGNLLREGFRAVWRSARGAWIRGKQFAPGVCRACADFALCQSACPLYWAHFGLDELHEYGERYVAAGG